MSLGSRHATLLMLTPNPYNGFMFVLMAAVQGWCCTSLLSGVLRYKISCPWCVQQGFLLLTLPRSYATVRSNAASAFIVMGEYSGYTKWLDMVKYHGFLVKLCHYGFMGRKKYKHCPGCFCWVDTDSFRVSLQESLSGAFAGHSSTGFSPLLRLPGCLCWADGSTGIQFHWSGRFLRG